VTTQPMNSSFMGCGAHSWRHCSARAMKRCGQRRYVLILSVFNVAGDDGERVVMARVGLFSGTWMGCPGGMYPEPGYSTATVHSDCTGSAHRGSNDSARACACQLGRSASPRGQASGRTAEPTRLDLSMSARPALSPCARHLDGGLLWVCRLIGAAAREQWPRAVNRIAP
jgi:hypothetical protein